MTDVEDCSVCLSTYDGDDAEFYLARVIVARRTRKCFECHETISVGESYQYVSGKWSSEWACYHFCLPCAEISTALSCGGGRLFGELWSMIEDEIFPDMTQACINKLTTTRAKRRLTERWKEWKGLRYGKREQGHPGR